MPLKSLSAQQWKSGIAAWLGWLFDGLDMHLYTVVAPVFVALLLHSESSTSADVKEKTAFIQAAFLVVGRSAARFLDAWGMSWVGAAP